MNGDVRVLGEAPVCYRTILRVVFKQATVLCSGASGVFVILYHFMPSRLHVITFFLPVSELSLAGVLGPGYFSTPGI